MVFIIDIYYHFIWGDSNPRVVSSSGRILRSYAYAYKSKYNKVLQQLVDKHRIFEKLPDIMGIPDILVGRYYIRMNKRDKEFKEFMLASKNKCRTWKNDQIELSPTVRMWPGMRWIVGRV